jgi:hypothetical protein
MCEGRAGLFRLGIPEFGPGRGYIDKLRARPDPYKIIFMDINLKLPSTYYISVCPVVNSVIS